MGGEKKMFEQLEVILQKRAYHNIPTFITIRATVAEDDIGLLMVSCALSPSEYTVYIPKSAQNEEQYYSLSEDMNVASCLAVIDVCMKTFPYSTTGALILPKSLSGMRELFKLANALTILG